MAREGGKARRSRATHRRARTSKRRRTRMERLRSRERGNGGTSLAAARKEEEEGVIGVLDLCRYVRVRGGRASRGERAERVNLSVGAALPRGASYYRPRFYCSQSRRYTKLSVLSAPLAFFLRPVKRRALSLSRYYQQVNIARVRRWYNTSHSFDSKWTIRVLFPSELSVQSIPWLLVGSSCWIPADGNLTTSWKVGGFIRNGQL